MPKGCFLELFGRGGKNGKLVHFNPDRFGRRAEDATKSLSAPICSGGISYFYKLRCI